ncbi:MAG: hypothetical protein AB7D07_12680 [Desulfovibrionaceae bacterium]
MFKIRQAAIAAIRGADNVPTQKQLQAIANLKLTKKTPYLVTREQASRLIREELEFREWQEIKREIAKKEAVKKQVQRRDEVRRTTEARSRKPKTAAKEPARDEELLGYSRALYDRYEREREDEHERG